MSNSSFTTSPPVAPITYHGAYSAIVSSQLIGSLLNFFLFGLLTAQTHTDFASPRTDTALNSSASRSPAHTLYSSFTSVTGN
ncbi:hypothetical protein C8J57DRAFT_1542571 [Mycena rebaudengoi]|nr:hypothetical protein C8J57DRAFT_1542571 [Mycena rebaudengoi]